MATIQTATTAKPPKMEKGRRRRLKVQILDAIVEHIRIYGRKNWDRVRERDDFAPLVGAEAGPNGERTFRRWVAKVTKTCAPDSTRPHETRAATEANAAWAAQEAAAHADHPVLRRVTPAYLMQSGASGVEKINLVACIPSLMKDIARMRDFALKEDPSGIDGLGVKDAKTLSESIRRTMELMESAIRLQRQIDAMRDEQQFHDDLLAVLSDELQDQPEVLDRVFTRIEELNARAGIASPMGGH
jgi:hypothetical protein